MRSLRLLRFLVLCCGLCFIAAAQPLDITVTILDASRLPVPGAAVSLHKDGAAIVTVQSDSLGHAVFHSLTNLPYSVLVSKDGFEPLRKDDFNGGASLELILSPSQARHESVEVQGAVEPVDQGSSQTSVSTQTARELPGRPATVNDALPLVPGIVRVPGGGLILSAAGEHRSALIVNSADVTDPATGQFGLTVPIDSVERLNFLQTPFLAEYGRFSAGLVSVETRRGGDKWKWDLNDPFPEFRIRSWQLRGLRTATPRLNLEGPLIANKLYFSEGLEYDIRKTPVLELPFPHNQKTQEGLNSFAQLDWIVSAKQLLTATVHVAPQRLGFVNINYFNPEPTAPDARTNNYTATIADHLSIGSGLFQNTLSITRFDARVWAQGPQDLVITPGGNSGNYFAQQNRDASRLSWTPVYEFAPLHWIGTHNFKAGAYAADSSDRGQVSEHPIDILDASHHPLERITFTGGQPFQNHDTELAFFGQDHWLLSPRVAIDLGLRTESQQLSGSFRIAPRAGISWNPFSHTVVRAGFGLFYDRVPLNVYSFADYPNQVITTFGSDGQISGGPTLYRNSLGTVDVRFPFVFKETAAGNFSPRSATGSVQVEQSLSQRLKLRLAYLQSQSSDLVTLNSVAPLPGSSTGVYVLSGSGQSHYRQFEATARIRLADHRELYFSYVRARAHGDLNDFSSFLGSFPVPVIRANQFGNLPGDLPNRFLTWGVLQLPRGFRVSPLLEFRSGFPYSSTDAAQNYVGAPNSSRFPSFFSLDTRLSKDFKVNPKYSVRLSVSGFNLTNHFNPEALHSNIADPANGLFFGQRGRRFTADFDVLF